MTQLHSGEKRSIPSPDTSSQNQIFRKPPDPSPPPMASRTGGPGPDRRNPSSPDTPSEEGLGKPRQHHRKPGAGKWPLSAEAGTEKGRAIINKEESCTQEKEMEAHCLENPMDRGAWWAAAYMVAQSQTRLKRLSMHACIGEGTGNPLQYSCLENPRDGEAWWAAVCGVTQHRT